MDKDKDEIRLVIRDAHRGTLGLSGAKGVGVQVCRWPSGKPWSWKFWSDKKWLMVLISQDVWDKLSPDELVLAGRYVALHFCATRQVSKRQARSFWQFLVRDEIGADADVEAWEEYISTYCQSQPVKGNAPPDGLDGSIIDYMISTQEYVEMLYEAYGIERHHPTVARNTLSSYAAWRRPGTPQVVIGWSCLHTFVSKGWRPNACVNSLWPRETINATGLWAAFCLAVHEFAHVLQGVRDGGFDTTLPHGVEWQAALCELIEAFVRPAVEDWQKTGQARISVSPETEVVIF